MNAKLTLTKNFFNDKNLSAQQLGLFIKLILNSTFKEKVVKYDGHKIDLFPGQTIFDHDKVAKIFGLDRIDTQKFIGSLIQIRKIKFIPVIIDDKVICNKLIINRWSTLVPDEDTIVNKRIRLIGYLNMMTGENFSHTTAVARRLDKFLKEGVTEEQLERYIDTRMEYIGRKEYAHLLMPSYIFNGNAIFTWLAVEKMNEHKTDTAEKKSKKKRNRKK